MFTEQAEADGYVKRAEISTFITEDDAGRLISNAVISADQITFEGTVTANENFKILEDGSIVANNGTFNGTINSDNGYIGGIKINSDGLGMSGFQPGDYTQMFLNKQKITFESFMTEIIPDGGGIRTYESDTVITSYGITVETNLYTCLLYTSDAADEL